MGLEVNSALGWSCQLESHTKLLTELLDTGETCQEEQVVTGEKHWILRNAKT